jgi:hypothetical protein
MSWKKLDEPTDDDRRELDLQYRGKAQFLVDENAGIGVAKIMQDSGYNAKFVADLGLREAMKMFSPWRGKTNGSSSHTTPIFWTTTDFRPAKILASF